MERAFFYLRLMLSKAQIKTLHQLKMAKYRRQQNRFIAEGSINVLDFVKGPLRVEKIYARAEWLSEHAPELAGTDCETVTSKEMLKISSLKNPSEVLAVIEKPEYTLPDITAIDRYVLALDDIKDPGNLGTIIRTADWFGIHDMVCSSNTVDAFNPKVVQASMGSLARVRVHYTDLTSYFATKPSGLDIFGAVLDGDDIRQTAKPGKGILLIGSEAHGISPSLYPFIDQRIRIPAAETSGAESLNAAVAASLVCYAFLKNE